MAARGLSHGGRCYWAGCRPGRATLTVVEASMDADRDGGIGGRGTVRTKPFDAALYLTSPGAQAELLGDALASGDAGYVGLALAVVARARGATGTAREDGVTWEVLVQGIEQKR